MTSKAQAESVKGFQPSVLSMSYPTMRDRYRYLSWKLGSDAWTTSIGGIYLNKLLNKAPTGLVWL